MTEDDAIARALTETGLGPEHEAEVRRMLADPGLADRPCCGGLCDPCLTALRRACDRVRCLQECSRA